jgi:tetratricopeptide (TPR) repeat protein
VKDYSNAIKYYTEAINVSLENMNKKKMDDDGKEETNNDGNTMDNKDNIHILFSNRAASYLALNKFKEAREDCEKCIQSDKTFLKGHLRLAMALKGLGLKQEALIAARQGIQQGEENEKVLKSIQNSSLSSSSSSSSTTTTTTIAKEEEEEKSGSNATLTSISATSAITTTTTSTNQDSQKLLAGLNDLKNFADAVDHEINRPLSSAPPTTTLSNNNNNKPVIDQELYQEYTNAAMGVQQTNGELQSLTRDKRGKELAFEQLNVLGDSAVTYQALGRMFLRKDIKIVKNEISEEIKIANDGIENLAKKMKFHEKKALDLKAELESIIKGGGGGSGSGGDNRVVSSSS